MESQDEHEGHKMDEGEEDNSALQERNMRQQLEQLDSSFSQPPEHAEIGEKGIVQRDESRLMQTGPKDGHKRYESTGSTSPRSSGSFTSRRQSPRDTTNNGSQNRDSPTRDVTNRMSEDSFRRDDDRNGQVDNPPGPSESESASLKHAASHESRAPVGKDYDVQSSARTRASYSRNGTDPKGGLRSGQIGALETEGDQEAERSSPNYQARSDQDEQEEGDRISTLESMSSPVAAVSRGASRVSFPDEDTPTRARPNYAQQRLVSTQSIMSTGDADYALQSGGRVPAHPGPSELVRMTSLGSLASGLDSEDDSPTTPRQELSLPTDTVIAQHVRDVEVPATLARKFGKTPRTQGTMTLKEQSTTIDRLMKENWNLKLKITFLDEVLNRNSDENIKSIMSENVELRTAKFQAAKDIRELQQEIRRLRSETTVREDFTRLEASNAELRREVGAQAAMLTSRNRERDRLQQEIEDLKINTSPRSDQEKVFLRREISTLTSQAEQALEELDQLDRLRTDHERLQDLYDNDISLATEDLQNLQRERDEALRHQDEIEADMQDMKAEGNEKIASLEHELDQRAEDSQALRHEVRALSERILHVQEEGAGRISDLQLELDLLGQEADSLEKQLREAHAKQESSQNEIAFLREEQDADKLKIGHLQDNLGNSQELEEHLRRVFKDSHGNRMSFIAAITKTQTDLDASLRDLETVRHQHAETEQMLHERDALLESHTLETRKLADLLDKERQGRRMERHTHEQWQRSHEQTTKAVTSKESRIQELESRNQAEKRRLQALETQYKSHLTERNQLLLDLWKRMAALLGSNWTSLINNHVPTLEVIAKESMYGPFSRNLNLALQQIEAMIVELRRQAKDADGQKSEECRALESLLESKTKQLEVLESSMQTHRLSGTFNSAPEIAKLRGENRLLKSELAALHKQDLAARKTRHQDETDSQAAPSPPVLSRHQSASAADGHSLSLSLQRLSPSLRFSKPALDKEFTATEESLQKRFMYRLKEMERRLKAEREARLLDRTGARKRLEEGNEENRRLRAELDREKSRQMVDD